MAAEAAAVNLCGRIARPPFLALVAATGPDKGWPSGPKPSGAFRHACKSARGRRSEANELEEVEDWIRGGSEKFCMEEVPSGMKRTWIKFFPSGF